MFFTLLLCYSSCCSSSVVPFMLFSCIATLTCWCSSHIVVFHATPLVLLLSHYNYMLMFSCYIYFPNAIPLALLLLLLCFSHLVIPLTLPLPLCYSVHIATTFALFFSHHCTFQVLANLIYVVFLVLSLLLLLCCYIVFLGQYGISLALAMCRFELRTSTPTWALKVSSITYFPFFEFFKKL